MLLKYSKQFRASENSMSVVVILKIRDFITNTMLSMMSETQIEYVTFDLFAFATN